MNRREVLKLLPIAAAAASAAPASAVPDAFLGASSVSVMIEPEGKLFYRPLEKITIRGAARGTISIIDGDGHEYLRAPATDPFEFTAGGGLGWQKIMVQHGTSASVPAASFYVDCSTEIDDEGGVYRSLMNSVLWSMMDWNNASPTIAIRYRDRVYRVFVDWVLDHTLTMKGMKYYMPDLKDAVDFFSETQREDGMIWENCYASTPDPGYFDWKFHYGDFIRSVENGFLRLRRAPVESHVEQFYLEALYYAWKATGDHEWMKSKLDTAIKAVHYVTHDPYRWSEKYQLVHRGFTIDTWDYISDDQQKIGSDCVFVVYLDKSEFGIFYGDNTNLIIGCRRLAEMLARVGRGGESAEFNDLADTLQARLDKLSWNGQFYTHWIAENENYHPDVGVDMSKQVSLSNAYTLNRGIPHDKCVAIIKTYQDIRKEMPAGSPGEFYSIYPPFEKDFTQNIPGMVWEYVDGGVLSIVAGELARGAFEHGYEEYAADILRRQKETADRFRGYLPVSLRGKGVETPQRTFQKLDLRRNANACYTKAPSGVAPWMEGSEFDLTGIPVGNQEFQGVPFEVIDPAANNGRCCIGIKAAAPYLQKTNIAVKGKWASLYLLHVSDRKVGAVGILTFQYEDGTSHAEYIEAGKNIGSCFEPSDSKYVMHGPRTMDIVRVAWKHADSNLLERGIYAAGINNPHPDRPISSIHFEGSAGTPAWMILAATLSSAPVFFAPYDDLSSGIPDGWSGAVTYAIVEGLAGIVDKDVMYLHTQIAPRWEAAKVNRAKVSVRYPASAGYCTYEYRKNASGNIVSLDLTGNGNQFDAEILLPQGRQLKRVKLNGGEVQATIRAIEKSQYAVVQIEQGGVHSIEIDLA